MTAAEHPEGPRPANGGPPASYAQRTARAGTFGMGLFLVSLSVLFVASLVSYVVIRARAESWPPAGMPPLPWGLWVSTGILLGCSVGVHVALRSARRDRQAALVASLLITTLLGLCFLASQGFNWFVLVTGLAGHLRSLYAFTFYMLTGLHAAHVIGGLILLGVVTLKAFGGLYSAQYHPGVKYAAMYWHFLDVVWLVMFAALLVG